MYHEDMFSKLSKEESYINLEDWIDDEAVENLISNPLSPGDLCDWVDDEVEVSNAEPTSEIPVQVTSPKSTSVVSFAQYERTFLKLLASELTDFEKWYVNEASELSRGCFIIVPGFALWFRKHSDRLEIGIFDQRTASRLWTHFTSLQTFKISSQLDYGPTKVSSRTIENSQRQDSRERKRSVVRVLRIEKIIYRNKDLQRKNEVGLLKPVLNSNFKREANLLKPASNDNFRPAQTGPEKPMWRPTRPLNQSLKWLGIKRAQVVVLDPSGRPSKGDISK